MAAVVDDLTRPRVLGLHSRAAGEAGNGNDHGHISWKAPNTEPGARPPKGQAVGTDTKPRRSPGPTRRTLTVR
jgi:hypothetical protein